MRRGWNGSPPIYRTSAPLGTETVMTPRPSRTSPVVLRGSLVAFVLCCPSRCSCSEPRRRSSIAFFGVLLPQFLPSSSSVTDSGLWYQQRPWSPAPVSTVCACSSFLSDPCLPSLLSVPFYSSSSSCPFSPSSSPAPVLPASSYTSSGSRFLLVSFFSRRAGLFAGAEASPGLFENGENGRTGTRTRIREDEAEALSRLKGADVTYGSRPDCTQLFRRAILMPWTPSTNHPFLSLLSS